MTEQLRRASRALISVSDKTGLIAFARALTDYGIELVSTGGTRKELSEAGLNVIEVSEITGFPEMMDGRVKTLHPAVHGGLLAIRSNAAHAEAMRAHRIRPIDLLVVNLYPFEQTVRARRALRRLHREYRRRRTGDDPRRGEEPRRCRGHCRADRLRRVARGIRPARRHDDASAAPAPLPPRPLRAPPPTMRRSPIGSPTSLATTRRIFAPSAAG